MEKKPQSFVKGAAILGIAGLIVKVIGAIFRIPLANAIGPVGMSYYEVVYPYYSGLLVISSAGLPTAISKLVAERVTLGDYRGARNVFNRAMLLLFIIGVVTSIFMLFGADYLASLSSFDKASLSFRALAPALLFVSIMCTYRGYLQGLQLMGGTAVSQIIEQLGKLIIGLSLAIKFMEKGPEYAAMGALIGVTVSELMALIVIFFFAGAKKREMHALARAPGPMLGSTLTHVTKNLLVIAVPITIGAAISPLTGIMDSAMIGRILQDNLHFSLEAAQTAYSLLRTNVTTLVNMPGVLTMALAMSLVPAISSFAATRNTHGVKNAARLGMKLALIIGLPCSVGLFVLGEPIIAMLYTRLNEAELALSGDLMRTASIGVLFLSLVQAMTGVIQGMGKPRVPVFNFFIGFILKVVIMLVLMNIPSINIQGAAVSTVVCYAYAGIMDTIYAIRFASIKINALDVIGKPLLSSLVMGVVIALVYGLLKSTDHLRLATLAAVLAGVLIYAALMFALKMFSPGELDLIPGGKRIKRFMHRGKQN